MQTTPRTITEIQSDLERLNNLPPTTDEFEFRNRLTMRLLLLGELQDLEPKETPTCP